MDHSFTLYSDYVNKLPNKVKEIMCDIIIVIGLIMLR